MFPLRHLSSLKLHRAEAKKSAERSFQDSHAAGETKQKAGKQPVSQPGSL